MALMSVLLEEVSTTGALCRRARRIASVEYPSPPDDTTPGGRPAEGAARFGVRPRAAGKRSSGPGPASVVDLRGQAHLFPQTPVERRLGNETPKQAHLAGRPACGVAAARIDLGRGPHHGARDQFRGVGNLHRV